MSAPDSGGPAQGSIILRKTGPLPNWVWMSLLLLVALVYSMWRRNRAAEQVETDEGPETEEPGDQSAPPVFILPQNPQPTVPINIYPPGPVGPSAPVKTVPPTPRPAPPIGSRPHPPHWPPRGPAAPTKPTPPVSYVPVKIVKYSDPPGPTGPPWASTMWGIAKHYGYGAAGNNYLAIWNDPKNAALKKKRGQPVRIQPGDIVYVRRR